MTCTRRLLLAVAAALLAAATPAMALAAGTAADHGSSGGLVVRTDRGAVRGDLTAQVRRFLGIPYAAPPVGDLRWRPPAEHPAWPGVRDATRFGSACPQPPSPFAVPSTDEDCLFLNVYTPLRAGRGDDRLPVMVWIHGGGLTSGAGSLYDPSALVGAGAVVVTINYRLGALGFLSHPALSTESEGASGNYGLMDQVAALRWVQRNVGRFGGDARNVTIFGESAGGLSVHAQLVSPLARGLFGRAIAESGAYSLVQPSQAAANASGSRLAAAVGCAEQTAACLRGVPVPALLAQQAPGALPTVDGRVLTESIGPALAAGRFSRVPLIEGTNHDEWRLFVAITELTTGTPLTAAGYEAAIEATLPGISAALAHRLATVDYPPSAYGGSPSLALGALGTDAIFACPARTVLGSASRFVPAFQYEFNDEHAPSPLPPVSFPLGAYHAAEIPYLFPGTFGAPLTPDQQRLSAAMIGSWARFARTGSPSSERGPEWPRYRAERERFESLVPPAPVTATGFATEHRCALWAAVG
jgi:para-nitrobenzyl esterase